MALSTIVIVGISIAFFIDNSPSESNLIFTIFRRNHNHQSFWLLI